MKLQNKYILPITTQGLYAGSSVRRPLKAIYFNNKQIFGKELTLYGTDVDDRITKSGYNGYFAYNGYFNITAPVTKLEIGMNQIMMYPTVASIEIKVVSFITGEMKWRYVISYLNASGSSYTCSHTLYNASGTTLKTTNYSTSSTFGQTWTMLEADFSSTYPTYRFKLPNDKVSSSYTSYSSAYEPCRIEISRISAPTTDMSVSVVSFKIQQ